MPPYQLTSLIAYIVLSNPPVNALSQALRRHLQESIAAAEADPAVKAIVLIGEGKSFSAGADVREFGQAPQVPALHDVCNRIEACRKPVVAAIAGVALGGGLEVALAAHYRIAVSSAQLGLPEVLLGLLPGAGGTQRLPRLIGVAPALDLMLSGRQIGAAKALALGLIDALAEDDLKEDAALFAAKLIAYRAGARPTRAARKAGDAGAAVEVIEATRREAESKARGLFSPMKIVDAVEASLKLPFDEGLTAERNLFLDCLASPQRQGLVHAFFAEREVAKVPEAKSAQPRAVAKVGVIGGGTMGAGIAVAVLDAGLPVTMIERDAQALARGRVNVERVYDAQVAKGRLDGAARDAVLARFDGATDYAALSQVDLVIEAVFEDMAVKKAVFAELDKLCKPGAVLATNTSYLDIDELAATISRPQDVLGLHFFSPANIMKLLEIVVPAKVAPDVVATGFALAKRLKKTAVRAGVCDGFIGNRILAVYRQAADYMVEDGASPYEIDRAMRNFGFAMGPYQVSDLAGGDIGWATRKRRAATRDPNVRYVQIADRICERGWFGQKTGRGYYLYNNGSRTGVPDPEVLAIIDAERLRAGIVPRSFAQDEIVRRYMAAMINEGANVVHQKIALRPLDVDVVFMSGYGFPRHRGGPMNYADSVGLDQVLAEIHAYAEEDALFWKPSPLLEDLVASGKNFASLNRAEGE
jgi:3-hydroxyacyl-CoA dehydrogenase